MTLRPGEVPGRAIAVFPFLKTTGRIQLGSFSFRSTDDTSELEQDDAANVREIADMLFLKDDLRVRSASYAMMPPLDLDKIDQGVLELERVQAIIVSRLQGNSQLCRPTNGIALPALKDVTISAIPFGSLRDRASIHRSLTSL
jgi:hypothetical protein